MTAWLDSIPSMNLMSVLIFVIFIVSVLQGAARGATGSARQLLQLVVEGVITVVCLLLAWRLMGWASPILRDWLMNKHIQIPTKALNWPSQMYYTFVTGLRDFSLMRSGIVFLISYAVFKHVLNLLVYLLLGGFLFLRDTRSTSGVKAWTSSFVGGLLGMITGAGRALMLVAVMFVYTSLFPQASLANYIQHSSLYQKGATEVVQPFTGDFIAKQLPVFTKAVQSEFNSILQRKYEVLDAQIPDTIADAAKEITAKATTDEEKAKALYQWVGTRVVYDWDKVRMYENQRIWKEQTPEDTFRTRKGVCIDYSRLYAVMARSVGLNVKVDTGLGYDGQGGYGPHAWNEVFLSQKNIWVPLDTTWVSSGGNWFNPPHFNDTHIKDA